MIRVVVVDDQPVVRSGIARILGPEDGFEIVAECGDGDEVADGRRRRIDPDLVLMDVRMRRMDGVTATRALTDGGSGPPVLVLTTFDDDDALWGALDAGAAGFVLKDASRRGPHRRGACRRRRSGVARPEGRPAGAHRVPQQRSARASPRPPGSTS